MTIDTLKSQLRVPVIAAPMFLVSGVELLVACSRNGIVGSMPALNARTSERFEQNLIAIAEQLTKADGSIYPYAINLIVHKTNQRLEADLALCVQYKVPVVITSLGCLPEVVAAVQSYGGVVLHDVVNKKHAEKALSAGVDGLIAVTNGAGGHAGIMNPFAFMQELRSFYKGPVALAGCINSGREVKAATYMGADFAYIGTRFIATHESNAAQEYKDMIVESGMSDVIYTDAVSGVSANFLRKSIANTSINLDEKGMEDFSKLNHQEAKAWKDVWSAGQGVAGIHGILSVRELIEQIVQDFNTNGEN